MKKSRDRKLNVLSVALLTGLAFIGGTAQANPTQPAVQETNDQKLAPIGLTATALENSLTPTLDSLKENNILLPQVSGYDSKTQTWTDGEPIEAPSSAYSLKEGTETDYSFVSQTLDENGNLTPKYYKIELNLSELTDNANFTSASQTPKIEWKEVDASEYDDNYYLNKNVIKVKLPNSEVKYFQYTYNQPEDYTKTTNKNNTLDTSNATNVVYQGISVYSYDRNIIYNNKHLPDTDITADFINNHGSYSYGNEVIIDNNGTIGNIKGDFISNKNFGSNGIIDNKGNIDAIIGNFVDNYGAYFSGAVIVNTGNINTIEGNFTGNRSNKEKSSWTKYNASGIGLYNNGTIGNIKGDFIGNYTDNASSAFGGAIYNDKQTRMIEFKDSYGRYYEVETIIGGIIGNISGDFIGNYIESNNETEGGAIYNKGIINDIKGDFISNHTKTKFGSAYGGAIYNGQQKVLPVTVNSSAKAQINNITGNFINNYTQTENGDALGGAIYNAGKIGNISGNFIGNSALGSEQGIGGAIYNEGKLTLLNSSFINNTATTAGGAIFTNNNIDIIADNGTSVFSGNKVIQANSIPKNNAIYIEQATVNFKLNNGGKIIMADNISATPGENIMDKMYEIANDEAKAQGFETTDEFISAITDNQCKTLEEYLDIMEKESGLSREELAKTIVGDPNITAQSTVNIDGDGTGTFYLLNDIRDAAVQMGNTTINTVNNDIHTYNFEKLTLTNNVNLVADVDLANAKMDRFTANSYGEHNGNLNVIGMNLTSDAKDTKTEILFADKGLKDNVTNQTGELPQKQYQTVAYTPIYKYTVNYDNRNDGGYFVFNRGAGNGASSNPSEVFNPAVLATPVAAQAGATATMNQTFNYAFQNADNFMNIPYLERISAKNANKYAISTNGNATDVGIFSPLYTKNDTSSAWVKPYASFENIPLKNGPKVSNITYGTLVGYDTELIPIKNGWDRVWTGYIGYNGASQRYSGVDSTQNGGLLGGTLTLYKGNFFNATTISAGASVANNQTMYGNEDLTMLLGGVGNKTGYNLEFKEGRLILQPSMLMSYTFVNTFDYTNAAGVKIKSNPLHAIQLAPGLKVIGNTKNGWQPYASVNMVWNLLDKSDVTAGNVKLPEMSIKPYIQYGVGVQKRFKDKCMAFGQAMIQNGGRNGISLTAGFRWSLGKDGKPIDKVHNNNQKLGSTTGERKILKQLSETQKQELAKKQSYTTRTAVKGVLKQL